MNILAWLETTPVAIWVRESVWGFPASLILHAWAMAFLVGVCLLLAIAVLFQTGKILEVLRYRAGLIIWSSFSFSLVSGVFLLSAYPAKALTNKVFWFKLVMIALALSLATTLLKRLKASLANNPFPASMKLHAGGLLLCWFATIASGRLLAYTYSILTVS